ncbi:MAG: undecaprenyldiphospho-muramoylpentapeptide beta-N-acetylglucosaminyltransferase [Flavobacteriales bacterium]|nr:undecaprenyldiphospho-muramoylpentapeptide beta-N-acetylglucosaminyltransferase [Flavobacteriales bacterium]
MRKYKVIISGGGTGGHVFPAIAIANALKLKHPEVEILFIGAEGRMEMEKVPAAGYKIEGLRISGLQRSLTLKNLSFPFKLISSLIKAKKILKRFEPDVAVGVGGYASGPMLHVAAKAGIPTLVQEQNSYPGITNKLLANKVQKICVAYDGMERFFPKQKILLTGNPVRQDIASLEGKKARGVEYFNIDPNKKTLLIIGGSLGARTINQAIEASLHLYAENDIQVIWQTGKFYFAHAKSVCEKFPEKGIKAYDFISKMDYAYAVADFVVSRAGAISVSELCLAKKPVILVPSPNVAEDHQTKNAMALVVHNAALLVKDAEAVEKLGNEVLNLSQNTELQEKLRKNIGVLGKFDAAEVIANEVISLIRE